MKKTQWETTLHDPNELTRLLEWSRNSGLNPQDAADQPNVLSHGFEVEQPHHLEKLTQATVAANNRSAVSAPLLQQIESFVPDLVGLSPLKALEKLEARFKSDPSAQNGLLLQSAINRITTRQTLDADHTHAVNRAVALFGVEDTKHSPPRTDDIWFKAYEHADFGGRSVFEDMTPGWGTGVSRILEV